jgi:hypothetical protein
MRAGQRRQALPRHPDDQPDRLTLMPCQASAHRNSHNESAPHRHHRLARERVQIRLICTPGRRPIPSPCPRRTAAQASASWWWASGRRPPVSRPAPARLARIWGTPSPLPDIAGRSIAITARARGRHRRRGSFRPPARRLSKTKVIGLGAWPAVDAPLTCCRPADDRVTGQAVPRAGCRQPVRLTGCPPAPANPGQAADAEVSAAPQTHTGQFAPDHGRLMSPASDAQNEGPSRVLIFKPVSRNVIARICARRPADYPLPYRRRSRCGRVAQNAKFWHFSSAVALMGNLSPHKQPQVRD